jgi:hypothetical protein
MHFMVLINTRNSGSRLIYLEALGQSILVINDITVAQDLFEKRSGLYSSRYADTKIPGGSLDDVFVAGQASQC